VRAARTSVHGTSANFPARQVAGRRAKMRFFDAKTGTNDSKDRDLEGTHVPLQWTHFPLHYAAMQGEAQIQLDLTRIQLDYAHAAHF
jgi:hypothetical protein